MINSYFAARYPGFMLLILGLTPTLDPPSKRKKYIIFSWVHFSFHCSHRHHSRSRNNADTSKNIENKWKNYLNFSCLCTAKAYTELTLTYVNWKRFGAHAVMSLFCPTSLISLPKNNCASTVGYFSMRWFTIIIAGSFLSSMQNNSSYWREETKTRI